MTVTATLARRPSDEALAGFNRPQQDDDNPLGGGDDDDQQSDDVAARNALGIAVQPLTPIIARQVGVPEDTRGVVVAGIDPASDAAAKGFKRGDVILSINQRPVLTGADVAAAVNAARAAGRNNVLLYCASRRCPADLRPVKLSAK